MITVVNRTVFHCKCVRPQCRHEWDAFVKPKRCAKCKYLGWNGEDNRRADPFKGVRRASRIPSGISLPQPRYGEMQKTFTDAREIIDQLIRDCEGSMDHEKEVLDQIDKQIEHLKILTGKAALAEV